MSTEVYIEVYIYVNKKENNQPRGRYYLGGTRTRQNLGHLFDEAEEITSGFATVHIPNAQEVKNFIEKYYDDFYSDHCADVLDADYLSKSIADEFSYWLVFEY